MNNKEINNKRSYTRKKIDVPTINHDVTYKKIRIISDDGVARDLISLNEALKIATSRSLDLVEISIDNNEGISICRILDYGKYKYGMKKKLSEVKKKQKTLNSSIIKEIKLRINIEAGDYNTKLKQIVSFIDKGYKVKITIKFRGREITRQQAGLDLLTKIVNEEPIKELIKVDKKPEKQNNQVSILIGRK
ncbi:translation initiation factor IF-3 [Anaplasmataceae bacterium AB001_6]|nr:translation initiation factor IF-3 [Anaplasmataceae bacterium AB001_6]